ncbi:MAG: zinc-ribbon domain-containing protein [Lachnospiraceae bacterium]|nr:zinc-ribbon domain-containing protein [Lachnospiraceae bacterium]
MKTCPNCGSMNADDARFCEGCGTALEEKEAVPQVEAEVVSEGNTGAGDAYSGTDTGNADAYSGSGDGDNNASGFGTSQDNGSAQFGNSGQGSQTTGYGPQGSMGQGFSGRNYSGGQSYTQQSYAPQNYSGQEYGGQNYGGQGYYQQGYGPAPKKDLTTVCTLALVFGIIGFFCDPLYIITTAAFILGIIGLVNNGSKKGFALAGLICSICACCLQVIIDICTLGIGVFF